MKTKRADSPWVLIGELLEGEVKPFKELSEFMLDILIFFHANAYTHQKSQEGDAG